MTNAYRNLHKIPPTRRSNLRKKVASFLFFSGAEQSSKKKQINEHLFCFKGQALRVAQEKKGNILRFSREAGNDSRQKECIKLPLDPP